MKIHVSNGYDKLKSCILCYPVNYRITSKLNKFYNKVDYVLTYNQYNKVVEQIYKQCSTLSLLRE